MSERRFRKGDRVQFQFTVYTLQGVVKEDRGPIGVKGRRLYLIEFPFGEPGSLSQVELPAEDMELVRNAVAVK